MSNDSTRIRILEAAGPIFAARGFKGATVRDICGSADVNLASVNYYFQDKENLYRETVRFARETQATRFPYPDWDSNMTPEEKFRGFIHTLMRRIMALQEAPWQVQLLMNEIQRPTKACRELVQDYFAPIFKRLMSVIEQMCDVSLPEDVRMKIGFSVIGQCLFYRFSKSVTSTMVGQDSNGDFAIDQLAEHVAQFSISAIKSEFWIKEHSCRQ